MCTLWCPRAALAILGRDLPESLSMRSYLDFEKRVAEIEAKVAELRALESADSAAAISEEISRLENKAAQTLKELYAELTPWQKTQVARHPERPHCLDYVAALITDFISLAGDRRFGEDVAIVGGFGRFRGESICVIGHEKGSSTESRLKHNFGMARPEGYRKAERLMQMADRFGIPVLSLVDTAGAYPGIVAEERGQAEAIARSTDASLELGVPNIAVIIGEGGSRGGDAGAAPQPGVLLGDALFYGLSPARGPPILVGPLSQGPGNATNPHENTHD